jgi:2-polyprenyl-3-methyl-5-hydroxy-6-metoxy-1,4-benzoquinol methylase
MSSLDAATQERIEQAIAAMLAHFRDNEWMLHEHWPLNEPHVRLMITDIMTNFPVAADARILDVGCFNGYISILFKQLGYQVTATDVCLLAEHRSIFQPAGIEFVLANMNELDPFKNLTGQSFDVVIIAQVIEHILNYPLGLIRDLAELMRPGGLMILTTPNPVTVMAAVRILKGKSVLWGTRDFIDEPKIENGRIISKGEIHYREYTSDELCHLLGGAGLQVERQRYVGLGDSSGQSALKRFVKHNPLTKKLMSKRLFASNHYFLARKP